MTVRVGGRSLPEPDWSIVQPGVGVRSKSSLGAACLGPRAGGVKSTAWGPIRLAGHRERQFRLPTDLTLQPRDKRLRRIARREIGSEEYEERPESRCCLGAEGGTERSGAEVLRKVWPRTHRNTAALYRSGNHLIVVREAKSARRRDRRDL